MKPAMPITRVARSRGLRILAQAIFRDRNASGFDQPGMPKRDRQAIKREMRPHLREAITWARKSRDALGANDIEMHELLRDRARMHYAHALLELFKPYASRYGNNLVAIAARSPEGARKTAERFARPDLDDVIRGCLQRGGKTRDYTKEWAESWNVSVDTIRRHIKRVEAEIR